MQKEKIKKVILFQVINAKQNRELLEQIPHEIRLDLALVFFYMEENEDCRKKIYLFNNEQMGQYGVTKEELRVWAMENTPRLLPVSFHSMQDVIREFELGQAAKRKAEQVPMYVLTNVKMFFGAACLFYPRVLASIGNAIQDDLYILPSSIHECIILPASNTYTRDELEKIVCEVNLTQVPEQEILSNHVYFYQKDTGQISK